MVNQSFAVLDDALDPRPLWTPGQLFIGGVGLAKGYWRDPEKTAASFVTDPRSGERLYRTGDLGRYLPGGAIEFLGREDFQVKVQGHRIELGEIEAALLRHPAVRAAVATATGDARGQKRLVAYVVLDEGSEATAEEVRVFLAAKLPEHMVPGVFLFLEELPLTANGKVDRKALPAPEALEAKTEYEAPRNDVERRLAEIWQEQLGGAEIGIHDNFFELGGDSLMAIRVITRAGEAGIRLEPRHVFEHQTIAELSPLAVEVAPAEAEPSWTEEEPASSEPDFADSGLAPDQLDKVLAKLKGMS
jgi:acyl carrier protein